MTATATPSAPSYYVRRLTLRSGSLTPTGPWHTASVGPVAVCGVKLDPIRVHRASSVPDGDKLCDECKSGRSS